MLIRLAVPLFLTLLTGCANLTSIGRTSSLTYTDSDTTVHAGKAIHLDAQQRIAFINRLGRICTEPAPDALAAVAGGFAASASAPGTGSGALSTALSQAIGQAGIRTQSITLMRDALYRMCEAYANGGLSEAQLMSFLSRSQDLTAVVLAVEQLTGPVVGNQVQLGSSASAAATATATSATDAIEAHTAYLERLNKLLASRRQEKGELNGEIEVTKLRIDQLDTELTAARTRLSQAGNDQAAKDAANNDIARLESEKQPLVEKRARTTEEVKTLDAEIADIQKNVENAETRLAELQTKQDQAITDSLARASASGGFSTPSGSRSNSDATIVAEAVKDIVTTALSKSYVVEGCMAILTSESSRVAETAAKLEGEAKKKYVEQQEGVREKCLVIVDNALEREILYEKPLMIDRGANAVCIRKWWDTGDNAATGQTWLRNNKSLATTRGEVIASETAQRKFIQDNNISCENLE